MSTARPGQGGNDTAAAAREHLDKLVDEVGKIQSELSAMGAKVSKLASEGLSRAQEGAAEGVHEAEEAVRRNPLAALAIAVGLGLLLGAFMRR
ncbi:DUF883 C-terminal domain-containing protein [Methyloceanibacter sp. wino2]|uniref:DUF883 C-terminal domain-containing protein n=1 Tax=Methyloceanibacter sp. wino2 TaxID=2170729 RepID=UPI000D3EA62D|nr:DUF883 C-terminal domain-containing protein [Methyloceanibacter sp. wino2]